jgi:WD40 repeat protein
MKRAIFAIAFAMVVIAGTSGVSVAYDPSLEVIHEYDDHASSLVDVEYNPQGNTVFSLGENGSFIAYDIQNDSVEEITNFEAGHALTVGDGTVYIAARDTLWAFDVASGELTERTTMEVHPQAIDYDDSRGVVWVGGDGTVYGYDADDGSVYTTYSAHSEGIVDIHANGDYIASGAGFSNEAVVYDVEAEEVAFRPTLPDDVRSVSAVHVTGGGGLILGTDAEDGSLVRAYDIAEQEQLVEYREHIFAVSALEYDEEHDIIISMGFDNTVKFFDVDADEVTTVYEHADTIYAGDIDTRNDALWIGDGEQRAGTVTAIDIFFEQSTPTPEPTADPTPESTPESTSDATVTTADTPEPTATAEEGSGFGLAVALFSMTGTAFLLARDHSPF